MNATPPAVRWAAYSGDCRPILTEGPKGPNTLGEFLMPVAADYDAETNRTRVGFSYVLPPEYAEAAARVAGTPWHKSYDAVAAIVAEHFGDPS